MTLIRQIRFGVLLANAICKSTVAARFAWIAQTLGQPIPPFKYIIVVTKECNSKCRNCLIWTETPNQEMTLEEYTKLAQASPQLLWLNLTGGEITLRADIVEIVRAFKKHCRHLEMLNFTTNGINPEKIIETVRALRELDFLKFVVNVSLDGPAETHDRLRGISGNFESAVMTFQRLRQMGVDSFISFTVYDSNYALFDQAVENVQRRLPWVSKRDFHLNLENSSAHFYGNVHSKKVSDTQESARTASRNGKIELLERFLKDTSSWSLKPINYLKRRYHHLAIRFLKSGRTPIPCRALTNSAYISEHGDLYPCVVWNEKIGSLRDENFEITRLTTSPKAADLRDQISRKQCRNCWTPCEAYHSLLSNPL